MNKNMETKSAPDWIDYIIEEAFKSYNGRKIVLWGKYDVSDKIKHKLFDAHGIEATFYVDSNTELQNNATIFSPSVLNGKSDEYYVIIPLAFYQSLKNTLTEYGYKKDIDYHYFCDCIVTQSEDYYEDLHGNKIIGNYKGLHFAFSGFNSVIELGENSNICADVYLHNNSYIKIGNNADIKGLIINIKNNSKCVIGYSASFSEQKCIIDIKDYAECIIGDSACFAGENNIIIDDYAEYIIGTNCIMSDKTIIHLCEKAKCLIGNNFSIGPMGHFELDRYTSVCFGNDCIFSYDILLRSQDGHSIFDVRTGENINSTPEINQNRKIVIGNHVWVGMRATILYNTEIGDGSIIGAGSLVKGKIPNNCIAAGVPARVVRRDVAWSRNNCSDNILDCGEEYIHLTDG